MDFFLVDQSPMSTSPAGIALGLATQPPSQRVSAGLPGDGHLEVISRDIWTFTLWL